LNFCISENAVGVTEHEKNSISVYPNPTVDFIRINSFYRV